MSARLSGMRCFIRRISSIKLLFLACTTACATDSPDGGGESPGSPLSRVEVFGSTLRSGGALGMSAGSLGLRSSGTSVELASPAIRSVEDWLEQRGLATVDAVGQLGLATSFSSRGFAANNQAGTGLGTSRLFINGHPDIARRFTRDLSTVESVEFVSAQDATLFGAAAPGAALNYTLKQPTGRSAGSFSTSLGTDRTLRAAADLDHAFNDTQALRFVLAGLTDERTAEGIENQRTNVYAAYRARLDEVTLKVQAESQHNASPFPFGTVYAGGRFWFDTPLVSTDSAADRSYRRLAVELQSPLRLGALPLDLSVYGQRAHLDRKEILFGFFTVTGPQTASGYFRRLNESYWQSDVGARLGASWRWNQVQGRTEAVWQRSQQVLDFAGPQSIGGFSLDLSAPDFSVDPNGLTLRPRSLKERSTEDGLGIANRVLIADALTLHLGLRRSGVETDSANNGAAANPVTRASETTTSFGIAWHADESWRVFALRSESFEPARGQQRDGSYVLPLEGKQVSAGFEFSRGAFKAGLNGFVIDQVNLPAVDPADRNFLINLGALRSEGGSLSLSAPLGNAGGFDLGVDGNYTRQHARVVQRTSPTQGAALAGAPAAYGSLRIAAQGESQRFWLSLVGVSRRPGDAFTSFSAPGFVRTDLGAGFAITPDDRFELALVNAFDLRYVQALSAADNVWQGPRRRFTASFTHRW